MSSIDKWMQACSVNWGPETRTSQYSGRLASETSSLIRASRSTSIYAAAAQQRRRLMVCGGTDGGCNPADMRAGQGNQAHIHGSAGGQSLVACGLH